MKNVLTITRSVVLVVLFLTALTLPGKEIISSPVKDYPVVQDKYDPSGVWNYEVETPEGNLQDVMTISKDDDGEYQVTISSDVYGDLVLEDISFEKMVMEASVDIEGETIEFEFNFDGDSMEGTAYAGEDELSITAERDKK